MRTLKTGWAAIFIRGWLFIIPLCYLVLSFLVVMLVRSSSSLDALVRWWGVWRPNAIDPATYSDYCLTPGWYGWMKAHGLVLMAGIVAAGMVYIGFSRRVWAFLGVFQAETGRIFWLMAEGYRQCSRRERAGLWILFGCILAYRLYMFLAFPMHMEDLASYLFFERQGLLVTATCYFLPNNHMLFNFAGACLAKLSWMSPRLVNRLPAMAGDLVLFYGIFCLFRRWKGYERAVIVVFFTAFCYMLSVFATRGRGYQWQEICALVSGLSAWECWCGDRRGERRGYSLFVLSSVAGLYINPTFVYHFTAILLMVLFFSLRRKEWGMIWSLGRAVLLTGAITFLFYLPVLMAGGKGGLAESTTGRTGVGWIGEQGWVPAYDIRVIVYLGGLSIWVLGGLAAGLLVLYVKKRLKGCLYDSAVVYLGGVLVSLACWSVAGKVFPPDRTLCFLALALYLVFINACCDLWKAYLPGVWFWFFLLAHAVISLRGLYWRPAGVNGVSYVAEYREISPDLERLAALHPRSWQITKANDYYPMHLRLYLLEHDIGSRVLWNREAAVGDVIFLPKTYATRMTLDGYCLWGKRLWTVEGDSMYIYVSRALLSR